ncbi:hypothetical protein GCM10010978_04250 [Compostibacillus humi]|uniref:TRASH domain-containing protein n=1 Tax=Compostibacillus humi TaxID=1245525 RepID=A0A8J2ZPK8_9BACI|nr:hypothetical protein [Compostibacillus humi]GGH69876.1 hypothetical protein GCM10010978_04250 [Compostibacillus humi]
MRFASSGYYVEKYEKCSVCGKLVYEERITQVNLEGKEALYCSEWCIEWEKKRAELKKKKATVS